MLNEMLIKMLLEKIEGMEKRLAALENNAGSGSGSSNTTAAITVLSLSDNPEKDTEQVLRAAAVLYGPAAIKDNEKAEEYNNLIKERIQEVGYYSTSRVKTKVLMQAVTALSALAALGGRELNITQG